MGRLKFPLAWPGVSIMTVLTLPSAGNVIPVENPAPERPVLPSTDVAIWTVPVNPVRLVTVSNGSAQYPVGIVIFAGLIVTVKSVESPATVGAGIIIDRSRATTTQVP